jgi:pyruvate dehydrogenase E1 component beta subunit
MIKAAIRDDDPVVFLEHKLLYARKEQVPDDDYVVPIGVAKVVREGTDVTVLTWSRQVLFALEAADQLAQEGVSAEVIDLRSLVPLDWEAIAASVTKTHHLVVVEEGVRRGGVGAEISAEAMEELYDDLDAPVARVAGLNVCSPFSPPLEDEVFPHPADTVAAVRKVLNLQGAQS